MVVRLKPTVLEAAQRLLAAREKTRAQLEQALLRRGYSPEAVLDAVTRLERLGVLSDRRAAALHARKGFEARQSTVAVTRKLVGLGLGEAEAGAAVAEARVEAGHDDEAAARALLARRRLEGVKAARFLASRGFDEVLIRRLLDLEDAP
ncbi:MAG: RecX family transcriptional regulator [Myxococcaceae bacterium]|nr:RecX family transcriptional regulator [Myxococcaceae bacterium]